MIMKKAITIFLAFVIVLLLTGCRGGGATTDTTEPASVATTALKIEEVSEENVSTNQFDAETAIYVTPSELYDEVKLNPVRAKLNTYIIHCPNIIIKDGYIYYRGICVYLPLEDLVNLNSGDSITFIGKITDIVEVDEYIGGGKFSHTEIVFGEASLCSYLQESVSVDVYPEYTTLSEDEVKNLIDTFGGNIHWTEGSCPYLINNRLSFRLIEKDEVPEVLCSGTWNGKYYSEPLKEITTEFHEDGTVTETENGKEYNWKWSYMDGLDFPTTGGDTFEIRMLNEDTLVFYSMGTANNPRWILYR